MSLFNSQPLFYVQEILCGLEEEAHNQSLQPKKMKTFSESKKSDRSHVTGYVVATPPAKEATPPAEADVGIQVNESVTPPAGSPRGILNKLGTRGRGGGKTDKKPATGKK